MKIKKSLFFFCFLCIAEFSFSQSKKEQIYVLQMRIDSIEKISKLEEMDHISEILKLNQKLDSLIKKLGQNITEINDKHLIFITCERERLSQIQLFETQDRKVDLLKKEVDLVEKKVDSLHIMIANWSKLNLMKSSFEQDMVFVEGGVMKGSIGGRLMNRARSGTVSSFNMGKYEVSQAQWTAIMGSNPSHFSGCDDCPVENVTWNEVQQFIYKLNCQTGKNYRLPTETEWEYAAKGGKQSRGFIYIGSNDLNTVAWYDLNSGNKTHSVGGKESNELGIYDMSGNVREWCSDWYSDEFPSNHAFCNTNNQSKTQIERDDFRILAGGGWDQGPCNASSRNWYDPNGKEISIGFRLVLPVE
jgi:formylglycine-generating enzyme required for sulfatase activity